MEEDIELIERYIAGDNTAVEELVVKYQRQIYAFVYRMTNDMEEAKDLTQKTFINAVKGIREFRRQSSFRTWLYKIAANTGLKHIRQRKEEVELEESVVSNEEGVLSLLIDKEKRTHIKKGMERLPERQRLAVVLRVYEGLSCSGTAEVMGCTEGAVKAHYYNGVKKLRNILREKGYEINA
ncbi:MAG: RNA polymerase sigma factor [Nitrospirae bacterium]|nr:RNA polymerase sigma factor [Nitrospirota bacterium]